MTLAWPELCSVRLQIVDDKTWDPVVGASIRLDQRRDASVTVVAANVAGETDVNGQFLASTVARGSWLLTVELDGYETRTRELELNAEAGQEQDWGRTSLTRFRPLPVQLVGAPAEETFEGYTTELNYTDNPFPIDQTGLGVIQVGWYSGPLEVIVKYPDGRHKVCTVHDVEPGTGDVVHVAVQGESALEIELVYSEAAREEIGDSKCWLRIASKGKGSDRFSSGRAVYGEGTYFFPDVIASEAEISFATTFGEWPVEWASTVTDLKEGETTLVALQVIESPRPVQFITTAGSPLADFSFRLTRVGDRTGFSVGNLTDEQGRTELMSELSSGFLLTGADMDGNNYALDVPFSFDLDADDVPSSVVGSFKDFFLDVAVDGSAEPGVKFDFHGSVIGSFFTNRTSDDLGRVGPCRFIDRSQIRVHLHSEDHWWDLPHLDLQPGRNVVLLSSRGTVSASSRDKLGSLTSQERGVAVKQWVQSGKVAYEENEPGKWSCRVPVGLYSLETGAAEPMVIRVSADQPAKL
ncbi:carboxypeptidase-like regulatory domain-containing protein [Saltatorellus ferox]|uniref:carboxypeptidase-like regulatory domain-containing protein n=1 Tax=Saltatorellus ferox TaxID=2528018 RepID=UPI003AF396EE